jgi:hypothetical protein
MNTTQLLQISQLRKKMKFTINLIEFLMKIEKFIKYSTGI